MNTLKIAVQKKGRLSEGSLKLLKESGIKISNGTGKLIAKASNFPVELLFLRDDDIPQYVQDGVADIGILGENEVLEKAKSVNVIERLGFSKCRLSLALPKGVQYNGIQFFNGKKIATSYPVITANYFKAKGIEAEIEEISGSVEIAPGIGLADGICDLVSTGSTLLMNGLSEAEVILKSEAVLIANKNLDEAKQQLLEKLLFRIKAVQTGKGNRYILLNAPNEKLDAIAALLPGMKSPTVMPLIDAGWSSVQSVISENEFWDVIDQLKALGAQGILIVPIEKMVA